MIYKNEKERCKACYPCPMGVIGCDEDRKPHVHGGTRMCPECGVPYVYIHPHSNFCSKGTPINSDVVHDNYYLNIQLGWKKTGINIVIRNVEKDTGSKDDDNEYTDSKDTNNGYVDGGQVDSNETNYKRISDKEVGDEKIDDEKIGDNTYRQKFLVLKLIPREKVTVGKNNVRSKSRIISPDEVEELKRFALMTINNRIEFCQKYKTTEEEIGKCVCESLMRYIRLSRESRTKTITKDQIRAIKNMFEEMKKEGKIKCQMTL